MVTVFGTANFSISPSHPDHVLLLQRTASDHERSAVSQQASSLVAGYKSLVLTQLDYGSTNLAGISGRRLDRLQSVLNAAALLVCDGPKYDHVSPLLRDLYWLRVPQRIKFRLVVLVYRCRNNTAPKYSSRDLQWAPDSDSRRRLRSSSTHKLMAP